MGCIQPTPNGLTRNWRLSKVDCSQRRDNHSQVFETQVRPDAKAQLEAKAQAEVLFLLRRMQREVTFSVRVFASRLPEKGDDRCEEPLQRSNSFSAGPSERLDPLVRSNSAPASMRRVDWSLAFMPQPIPVN